MTRPIRIPCGDQQITSLTTATALTPPDTTANLAVIQCETSSVRWRDTTSPPTASVGNILPAGAILEYDGDLTKFKAIDITSGAKLNISYYFDPKGQ